MGILKTIQEIRSVFIWLKMDADIRSRIWACDGWTLSKPASNIKIGVLASELPIYIYFMGKLSKSRSGSA